MGDQFLINHVNLNTKLTLSDILDANIEIKRQKRLISNRDEVVKEKIKAIVGEEFEFHEHALYIFEKKFQKLDNLIKNSVLLGSTYAEVFAENSVKERLIKRAFYKLLFGRFAYLREEYGLKFDEYVNKAEEEVRPIAGQISAIDEELGNRIGEQTLISSLSQQLANAF